MKVNCGREHSELPETRPQVALLVPTVHTKSLCVHTGQWWYQHHSIQWWQLQNLPSPRNSLSRRKESHVPLPRSTHVWTEQCGSQSILVPADWILIVPQCALSGLGSVVFTVSMVGLQSPSELQIAVVEENPKRTCMLSPTSASDC